MMHFVKSDDGRTRGQMYKRSAIRNSNGPWVQGKVSECDV